MPYFTFKCQKSNDCLLSINYPLYQKVETIITQGNYETIFTNLNFQAVLID